MLFFDSGLSRVAHVFDGFLQFCVFGVRYELAEECCDDDDAKVDFSDLRKSVLEELKMHDSFVQVIS